MSTGGIPSHIVGTALPHATGTLHHAVMPFTPSPNTITVANSASGLCLLFILFIPYTEDHNAICVWMHPPAAEEFEAMLGFVLDASSQLHGMAPDCQARGGRAWGAWLFARKSLLSTSRPG